MAAVQPAQDCALCPRLAAFRHKQQAEHPDWFNGPVPSFGDPSAELLIVGLAPGLRGANRTGRPFTGDYAGDLLYATLLKFGLASGTYEARPDDGLRLLRSRITNAVRCVPPENKPEPAEATSCRPFLAGELAALPNLRAILALGQIAHHQVLSALGLRRASYPFGHGTHYAISRDIHRLCAVSLISSYHCSRYNTNTGRLTPQMFEKVFKTIILQLNSDPKPLEK